MSSWLVIRKCHWEKLLEIFLWCRPTALQDRPKVQPARQSPQFLFISCVLCVYCKVPTDIFKDLYGLPCTRDCLPNTSGTSRCYQLMWLQHQFLHCWVYAAGKVLSFHPQIHTPNGAPQPEFVKLQHINIFLRKLVPRLEKYFQELSGSIVPTSWVYCAAFGIGTDLWYKPSCEAWCSSTMRLSHTALAW